MINNKILLICSLLTKDHRHLYSLVDKNEVSNLDIFSKISKFYEKKREELREIKYNEEFFSLIKKLKEIYKDNLVIINQEVDNIFQKNDIEVINLHGNIEESRCLDCNKIFKNLDECPDCKSKNYMVNVTLKNEKGQYQQVVELIDECQNLIFIGDMGQLDPTLFLDEMSNSLYINKEEQKYDGKNPYVEKKELLSDYFDQKFIYKELDETINLIESFFKISFAKSNNVNKNDPYKNNSIEIIETIENYYKNLQEKYNIEKKFHNKKLLKSIHQEYPFTKKLPDVYIGNIWYAYCNDVKIDPNKVIYDDLFYDMLLVYSLYKWEGTKKFFTKRPKISLVNAYNRNNQKEINIFKKLLLKKDFIE